LTPHGKSVTVARFGEEVPPYKAFDKDASVNDVLSAFGESLDKGESLAINGQTVKGSSIPEDKDTIYIAPSTTGA